MGRWLELLKIHGSTISNADLKTTYQMVLHLQLFYFDTVDSTLRLLYYTFVDPNRPLLTTQCC